MDILYGVVKESYLLLDKMSVYLLFGFFFAGILHIFLKEGTVGRHLGKNNFLSVVKASLFGIPLPLCSCGVIPAALSIKKDGASKGAVLSFLISTPTTGVDSIFATYALFGGLFTVYRVAACFVSGVFAGVFANIFLKKEDTPAPSDKERTCKVCCDGNHSHQEHTLSDKVKGVFTYAFGDLMRDAGKWLFAGILIGGIISYLMPQEFITSYLSSGWRSMLIMIVIAIPMYVCSTGSLPIAAALMLKGLNPGAAFVFLLAGPATNSVALTVIAKEFGKKTLFVFLSSIIFCSFALGALLNHIWKFFDVNTLEHIAHHTEFFPSWVRIVSSSILLLSIALTAFPPRRK
ncbi:MAG: SO_0444 family Cu/Zn efflux transporter [Candidatus Omnitrophota bacterium]